MRTRPDESDFWAAYRESDSDLRVRHARAGCVLALILMPAGTFLDTFVYSEHLAEFLVARWLCDLSLVPVLLLLFCQAGRRLLPLFGMLWALLPGVAIAWMIYWSEGPGSPYYAGLNIVILGGCLLMPYTVWEAVFFCAAVMAMYIAACLTYGRTMELIAENMNNLYFITLTSIAGVASSYFYTQKRIEDFRLRYELDERNRELSASYDKLAEMDRLRSEFFANISHELRTPLTLILSPLDDMLRRGELPDETRQHLRIAHQNGLRLLKLINDMLEVVRLENGRLRLDRRPLDLPAFLRGTVESVRHLGESKGLSIRAEGDDTPLVVDGDADRLEKVFLNLLSNAIKFTDAGGSVWVTWGADDGAAVVEVRDTGIGIPEEELPRVFDRFRQVDGSTTRQYQGAGIGLALARELVDEHGGDLRVYSRPGAGTRLTIRLPRTEAPAETPSAAGIDGDPIRGMYEQAERGGMAPLVETAEVGSPSRPETRDSAIPTVLVVDDEPDMRRYLLQSVADAYRTLSAADGHAALRTAHQERPDLVVLDLMLPGVDGFDVCRQLKEEPQTEDMKVVILTARTDEGAKLTALQHRADDFLTKPFSTVELKTRLGNLLQVARLQADLRERNKELSNALERLQQTQAQLVQSEKMGAVGGLAAGLLHEINNPLNFTLTAIQMAQVEAPENDGDLHDTLNDIQEGMTRIRDIVADLRTFAHPATPDARQRFQLEDAVETALRLVGQELRNTTVRRELAETAPVEGSKSQIIHVLMNVLVNAARAIEDADDGREGKITLGSERAGDQVRVRVKDNGVGIAASEVSKVFDPFYTTRDVGEGTGLGLSTCRTIVSNHSGTMDVRSEEGVGTEISFTLPFAK